MLKFVLFLLLPLVIVVGEWQKVQIIDPEVKRAAKEGVKFVSQRTESLFHLKLVEIKDAERKFFAGFHYKLKLRAAYTTCKKSEVKVNSSCRFQEGPYQSCDLQVYRNMRDKYSLTNYHCEIEDEIVAVLEDKKLFDDFIVKYEKTYKDCDEKMVRFSIFQRNLKKIKIFNEHEEGMARYGVTKFADLTEKEFTKIALGLRPNNHNENEEIPKAEIPNISIPESFDWRDKKIVTAVKDQKKCGSCWAFSAIGNIEGQWALKKKTLVSLSEQELIDCDNVDQGCNGGLQTNAYKEIIRLGGLEQESDYPYDAAGETCQFSKSKVKAYINGSVTISTNETEMTRWLVKNGPIAIGINGIAMQFYLGGVARPPKALCDPSNLNHGSLIVGYGLFIEAFYMTRYPFWNIKTSFGRNWGENGYYTLYKGAGTCGVNLMASSAVVN